MAVKYLFVLSLVLFSVYCQDTSVLQSGINDWISCADDAEFTNCIEDKTIRKLHEINVVVKKDLISPIRLGKNVNNDNELKTLEKENKEIMEKIKSREKSDNSLLDEVTDLFTYGVVKIWGYFQPKTAAEEDSSADQSDSRNSEEDEGMLAKQARGHKKKYLKKQNKKLKIILLLMLFKHKVKMFVAKFQVLLQLKFLALTFANLLVNTVRLWWDFKKQYKPNKVVYYENAHHQHHYDHEHVHDHDDGHYSYPSSHSRGLSLDPYEASRRSSNEGIIPITKKNMEEVAGHGQDRTLKKNLSKPSKHLTRRETK